MKKSSKKKKSGNHIPVSVENKGKERQLEKNEGKQRLSACMIVRNEENFLKKCLESIKDVADEIIVIDTGSNDHTIDIARKFTDKVFLHPWEDHFSKARNQALSYATGDWILIIDADEELVQEDIPNIKMALENREIDAIMVQVISKLQGGRSAAVHTVERILRNNGMIHHEGRVHNRVVGMTNARVYPIRIIHHGYDLNPTQSDKKFDRTVSLLKMDLAEDPHNPITYHYLSCSYLSRGMDKESLEAGLTAIRMANAKNEKNLIYLWSHYNAAMASYRLQDLDSAENISLQALKKYSKHIDSHFILTLVSFDKKHWSKLLEHGREYLRLIDLFRTSPTIFDNLVTCSLNEGWNVHFLIGIGNFELGQPDSAYDAIEKAASSAPNPFTALRAAGIYFYNKKATDPARLYLERAQHLNQADETVNDLLHQILPTSKEKKPTISCCMIVKNEEAFLEQCLKSIKDHVEEIIIVDTGSTDRTVEIARGFTDKIYFHAWEDSFSKARNQALQYATCDWIFQIDGDEELLADSGERLRQTVREAGHADSVLVNIISTYSNGSKTARHNFERLFRNNGVIRYEGIVHNSIVGHTATRASKIELMHYGYNVEEKKAQEKFIRTTALLRKQIEENPDDPKPHHYLGTSYLARGLSEEAARESVLAIDLADKQDNDHPLYLWTHHNAAYAFFRLGDFEKARHYSVKALEKFSGHLDSLYMLTMVAAEKGEWMNVLSFGKQYLERRYFYENNPDQAGLILNSSMKEGSSINLLMGHAFHAFNDCKHVKEYYQNAYELADEKWKVWWNVGTFHMDRSGHLDMARQYLGKALAEAPEEESVWYMLAKLNGKCGLFAEERRCLEQLLQLGTGDAMVLNRLATLCIEVGDLDQAREATDAALKADASNYPALCNLGLIYKRQKFLEKSVSAFMKAVEIHPHGASPWMTLGEISLSLNNLGDAKIFFENAISFQSGLMEVLLQLCNIDLRLNAIDDFVRHGDQLLQVLELKRNRTLNSMEDIAVMLLDIDFALRHRPELAALAFSTLSLLPVDFQALSRSTVGVSQEEGEQEKGSFVLKRLNELNRLSAKALVC